MAEVKQSVFGQDGTAEFVHHTIGYDGLFAYVEGAVALSMVWGGLYTGILSPVILCIIFRCVGVWSAAAFLALCATSVLAPLSHSPAFCRFYLSAAACTGGATIWIQKQILSIMKGDAFMICMHPHGILPLGFSFNGAIRVKTMRPDKYLPADAEVKDNCNGIQAPVLWRIPFMASVLRLWGACTPATKSGMKKLLASRVAFGILPGGSEEVAIHEYGQENVYINSRYGFIKYGLEHGYTLVIAYTFGESDQYHSVVWLRTLNLWLVKRFGFVLPIFWGKCVCPLLPKGGGLNTVFGEAVELPKIEKPSNEDVVKWHKVYVDALTALFDRHKARFGYGDRTLKCF